MTMSLNLDEELAFDPAADQTAASAPIADPATPDAPRDATGLPVMEILPADFPLPLLTRFVPDRALLAAVQAADRYAAALTISGPEGIARGDVALTALKDSVRAIERHFEEPASVANRLHKSITGLRAEWCQSAEQTIKTVGRRIWIEQDRLKQVEAEERRRTQAEADRLAREDARREAEAAAAAQAPAPVVEALTRRAETATAPPVARPVSTPALGNAAVTTWRARLAGSDATAEPNPKMAELTADQAEQVREAMRGVLAGTVPLTVFEINWPVLNGRAKADKSTFAIAGFEAFKDGGTRAKASRR